MTDLSPFDLVAALRGLCRPVDDGGAAEPLYTGDDEPGFTPPVLAVPVEKITALLDRITNPDRPAPGVSFQINEAVGDGEATGRGALLQHSLADLIATGRKISMRMTGPLEWNDRGGQFPDLDTMDRAVSGKPTMYRPVTPDRAAVTAGTTEPDPIAHLADTALRRAHSGLSATGTFNEIRNQVLGVGRLTRTEVIAALATLFAAGRITAINAAGPYYIASAWTPEPGMEPALAVLVAEHLDDAGATGSSIAWIAVHLTEVYDLRDGTALTPARVIAALRTLADRGFAVEFGGGLYYAPQHAPI